MPKLFRLSFLFSITFVFWLAQAADLDGDCSVLDLPVSSWPAPVLDPLKPTVIVVDGYSSGRLLAPAFRDVNFQIIHVHSRGRPAQEKYERTFVRQDYDLDVAYLGDLNEIIQQLSPLKNIVGVVPGADSGGLFADQLALALKQVHPTLPANGIQLGRKNKYLQGEVLRASGIDVALQIKTADVATALTWVDSKRLLRIGPKAVVVKPINSAGTEDVFICTTTDEIVKAIRHIVSKPDEFGHPNEEALIQEYLPGDEYVVNTTSRSGRHLVTDIWLYKKRSSADGKRLVYDHDILLPFEGEMQSLLIDYTLNVIKALNAETGNGHTEIKMVPGRGPVLVEFNNRMMGSNQPLIVERATGHSQVDRTVLAFSNPEIFAELKSGYEIKKEAAVVTISNWTPGVVLRPEAIDMLKAIKGYQYHSFSYSFGQTLEVTNNMTTAVGDVFLLCDSPQQLQESIAAIRHLEASGKLFQHP